MVGANALVISRRNFSFRCIGTSIEVFGTISAIDRNGPPVSSYSIDNGTAFVFTGPTTNTTIYQQPFFRTNGLEDGEHTLVIRVDGDKPAEFRLDYILVCNECTSIVTFCF